MITILSSIRNIISQKGGGLQEHLTSMKYLTLELITIVILAPKIMTKVATTLITFAKYFALVTCFIS